MTLEGAKNIIQLGFVWANWTSEQKEAFRTVLLETKKIKQLEKENSELTSLMSELTKIVEEWVRLNAEERLLELPCKVGDTVYEVNGSDIAEITVFSYEIDKDCTCVYLTEDASCGAEGYSLSDFGETLFINKADAINALARCCNDK